MEENLPGIVDTVWIGADVDVIQPGNRPFGQILGRTSPDADLAMMGMAKPDDVFFETYYQTLIDEINDLPTTVLTLAGGELSFGEVLIQLDRTQCLSDGPLKSRP